MALKSIVVGALILAAAPVRIVKVTDGDTFKTQAGETVRVLGIDCPESHPNAKCMRSGRAACEPEVPRGLRAARWAESVLMDAVVTLEGKGKRDRYGRTLAYVRLRDGTDFGLEAIRMGYCADWSKKYPHERGAQYAEAAK